MQLEIMTPWLRARRVLIAGLSYCLYISTIRLTMNKEQFSCCLRVEADYG